VVKHISLFDYQKEDVAKLYKKRSRLVGNDPGTGKTYVGIALDIQNRLDPEVNPDGDRAKTLVVCPKSVIDVWDQHCMDLTDQDVYIYDDEGLQPKKARENFLKDVMNPRKGGYFILHWEGLRNMPELQKLKFLHIIADEVHRAKNRKSQQTRALKKLRTTFKTGMSGTPADNKPQDLWSILNWLWPKYYTSFWKFVKAYMISEHVEDPSGETTGYMKVEKLNEDTIPRLWAEMSPWYVRRRKKDVLKDLPDKYNTQIMVDLLPIQRRAYNSMKKTMVAWIDTHREELERKDPIIAQAAVSQLIRLQQFANGYTHPLIGFDPMTGNDNAWVHKWNKKKEEWVPLWEVTEPSSKLDTLMDLLRDRGGEQIVIFSQFKSIIRLLEKRLVSEGISYGLLTGDVSQADRNKAVSDFQAGKIRVFAGTIAAGGVGITLTAASTIVFVDRSWSPAINLQAEDRLHRIGQKEAVEVIDLVARNTVDLGKHQKLAMKWKTLQMLLGDTIEPSLVVADLEKEETIGAAAEEMLKREFD
jgi:SNF2 family DNA or RNA helicase